MHFLLASVSDVSNLSPIVQLDFGWTLQICDRENDRLARPSTVWRIPWLPDVLTENYFTEKILQMKKYLNYVFKKITLSFKQSEPALLMCDRSKANGP